MSGGRPEGTTLNREYRVGISSNLKVDFSECDLSTASNWDISSTMCNMNDSLCTKLIQRINTQRAFDQQPLTKRICWQCGHVLWGDDSSKGTYIIDPPKGMKEIDAPANAFLASVNNCFLTFEHDSVHRKWYSCAYCKTNQMPAVLYVGDVLEESDTMKPVKLWDMRKPQPIAHLLK